MDAAIPFLKEQEIDACVITETFLNPTEADRLRLNGHDVMATRLRVDVSAGGILTLASADIDSEEIKDMPTFPPLLNICSVSLYPRESEASGIRFTRECFPPSADI